jgi:hypothetical protein
VPETDRRTTDNRNCNAGGASLFGACFAAPPSPALREDAAMTLCPVALAVGCRRCAVFAVCPLKGVIGDYRKDDAKPEAPKAKPSKR